MKSVFISNWIKFVAFSCVVALLIVSSCQKESITEIDESEADNLTETSELKTLLHNISLHDGSFDDFIDGASCFSIKFPYTLQVDGVSTEVTSIDDLTAIDVQAQVLKLKFPITIANSKHEEEKVSSQERLEKRRKQCTPIDDDIECIDVQYPITIGAFDTRSGNLTTTVINHDRDLYFLTLRTILTSKLSIQYPIIVKTKAGESIGIEHNEAFEDVISAFKGSCDEGDS